MEAFEATMPSELRARFSEPARRVLNESFEVVGHEPAERIVRFPQPLQRFSTCVGEFFQPGNVLSHYEASSLALSLALTASAAAGPIFSTTQ